MKIEYRIIYHLGNPKHIKVAPYSPSNSYLAHELFASRITFHEFETAHAKAKELAEDHGLIYFNEVQKEMFLY